MESDAGYAVITEGMRKEYDDIVAVQNLCLKIPSGCIYGLIGPNGSGKTTAIKVLMGLVKASGGSATVLGQSVPIKGKDRRVSYMPQELALYTDLTVHENAQLFSELNDMEPSTFLEREKEVLEVVGLMDRKDDLVGHLSGGMQHRASLACALINDPTLMFLDEPTVGVDPELRAGFWEHFRIAQGRGHDRGPHHALHGRGLALRSRGHDAQGTTHRRRERRRTFSRRPGATTWRTRSWSSSGGALMNAKRTFAVTRKVLRSLRHDRRTVGFLVLMPIFMIAIFGFTFGGEVKDVEVYVVNLDQGAGNVSYADLIVANLQHDETLKMKEVVTPSSGLADPVAYGRDKVENGEAWACIVFPADFTLDIVTYVPGNSSILDTAAITLLLDGSNTNIMQAVTSERADVLGRRALPGRRVHLARPCRRRQGVRRWYGVHRHLRAGRHIIGGDDGDLHAVHHLLHS